MSTDTSKYKFNHSMLRVKDPKESGPLTSLPYPNSQLTIGTVKFYEFFGLKQINKLDFPENKFTLYFLAYDSPNSASPNAHWTDRQGVIELTHNHGSENDPSFKIANGNSEPGKGFGHLCVSVDNIQAACQRLEDAGYKFQKKLTDGRMKSIAFALDPDGYWVEIIGQNVADKTEGVKETDPGAYRMNHTMIRVKDHTASLNFYQEVMGMTLTRTSENSSASFNLYFLGYPGDKPVSESSQNGTNPGAEREGLLELTWNYGTEKDADFKYHDGNAEPQGFGHIAIAVDDIDAACKRFEEKGVNWKKRLTDGRMKNVAFVLDPDGYWIEVVQNEKLKRSSNW
ncbi:Lactoylglutathione lyase [Lignoscripta atroalba]|nr:Lactoylglutathione lyase [Lignoscripta atroalba]